jgi:hypothetical protein
MDGPLVTLGMPVYEGGEDFREALRLVTRQSYQNLEVLISVDNRDTDSAEIAQPFLADPRFRLEVQPTRLGWDGSTDWTMRNRRGEYFIYLQHDDRLSPTYVADLVAAAQRYPAASVLFSRMLDTGEGALAGPTQRLPSLTGEPVDRALAHIESLDGLALRGLIRGTALERTRGLGSGQANRFGVEHRLLTELALAGEMRFVDGPTYYKRMHGRNLHLKYLTWPEERRRDAWAWLCAAISESVISACASPAERTRVLLAVLDRFLTVRGGINWLRGPKRWLDAQDAPVLSTLRRGLALARRSGQIDEWARTRSRHTFCRIDMRDHRSRAALLAQVFARLSDQGLDFPGMFGRSCEEVERLAAGALEIRREPAPA